MTTTSIDKLGWVPLAFLAVAVLFMGGAALGWLPSGSGSCRGVALLFGLCLLSGTLIRPAWFWNRRKTRRWRAALGDRLYAGILIGLALLLVYAALLGSTLDECRIR
jgi:hypothetical protein